MDIVKWIHLTAFILHLKLNIVNHTLLHLFLFVTIVLLSLMILLALLYRYESVFELEFHVTLDAAAIDRTIQIWRWRMRPITSQLTRDKVINELRHDILCGNFAPNQELYQDKIADELGVSRLPVREALAILHNEGLVTVRPNKVATVNEISSKFVRDHYALRVLLEVEAVRLACSKASDCSQLWEAYNESEQAINEHRINLFNEHNRTLHEYIWKFADNNQLERLLSQLWNTMRAETEYLEAYAKESNEEHKNIIIGIENHDEQLACSNIKHHVERSCERTLRFLRKQRGDAF